MPERVLLVDDDENVLDSYRRRLGRVLDVEICTDPIQGLTLLRRSAVPFAVIISDYMMPKMNGVEFLAACKELSPESVRIMLTGVADFHAAMDAVNSGSVFRFLMKPCPPEIMGQALVDGIEQYRLVRAHEDLLNHTLGATVELFADVAIALDPATFGRVRYLRPYVAKLAQELKVGDTLQVELAWMMSNIGAAAIPGGTLSRSRGGGDLSAEERAMLEHIAQTGADMIEPIARLEEIGALIRYHTKGYDGSGMPADPIQGERIPLGARILKVFRDISDSLAAGRSIEEAVKLLGGHSERYDPKVLKRVEVLFKKDLLGSELQNVHVKVPDLQPGDILDEDVCASDGRVILASRTVLSLLLIERLRNHSETSEVKQPIKVLRSGVMIELD